VVVRSRPDGGRNRRRWTLIGAVAATCLVLAGAGAAAAVEDRTVGSFGDGLMWAVTLMTTAGFIDGGPDTSAGDAIAVVLMIAGFLLLSLASAVLAAMFVRDEEVVSDEVERGRDEEILARLEDISARLAALEARAPIDPRTPPDRG
jgi:voltage-gated potassium channel